LSADMQKIITAHLLRIKTPRCAKII
jgi:hypothetical protein